MTVALARRADIDLGCRASCSGRWPACLAAAAGQSFAQTGREAPPALVGLLEDVLELCPPIEQRRSLGPDLAALAEMLRAGVPD